MNQQDIDFSKPYKLSPYDVLSLWKKLQNERDDCDLELEFFIDCFPLFKDFFQLLIKIPDGAGRPPKTRIGQFLFYIHLQYFDKRPLNQVMKKVNRSSYTRKILCLGEEELTPQSFDRFQEWLSINHINLLFENAVKFACECGLITGKTLVIDSGPVKANVNNSRTTTYPKHFRRGLFHVFKVVDDSLLNSDNLPKKSRRYNLEVKIKMFLTQILCGLGSTSQLNKFIKKQLDMYKLLGYPEKIPSYQAMINFHKEYNENQRLKSAINALLPEIIVVLEKICPQKIQRKNNCIEHLFGVLGTKFSRVDPDARIGTKSTKGLVWSGYKDHPTVDQETSLPVLVTITRANVHDSVELKNHVKIIKKRYSDHFIVKKFIADRGYDSEANRNIIRDELGAKPLICKRNATKEEKKEQKKWNSRRQVVEQVISRAQEFARKSQPRVRGLTKVHCWVSMSYLIILLIGIALFTNGEPERIREVSFYL